MLQEYIEEFRIYVLGNSISIPDGIPIETYIRGLIVNNNKFSALIIVLFLMFLVNFLLIIKTKCNRSANYYLTVAGIFLVISGLVYKFSVEILQFDALNQKDKLSANRPNNDKVESTKYNIVGKASKFVSRLLNQSSLIEAASLSKGIDMTDSIVGKHSNPSTDKNKPKDYFKRGAIDYDKTVSSKEDTIDTEESNEVQENDTSNEREIKENGDQDKPEQEKENSVNISKPKKFIKAKSMASNHMTDLELIDDENDIYMKKILKNFEFENATNKLIEKILGDIKEAKERLIKELRKFQVGFDEFYDESIKIEEEMMTFNVFINNYKIEAQEVAKAVNVGVKLSEILENVFKKTNSEHILHFFDSKETGEKENTSKHVPDYQQTSIIFLTIYFCFQIALFLYFLASIIGGLYFSNVLRILMFLCLTGNMLFGVYMMIYSQILDKICVVGNIDGCKSTFTNGFTKFAATTGLNLKMANKSQKDKIYAEINKAQIAAADLVAELSNYIEFDPVQKHKTKLVLFTNLFDKIKFVKDEFEMLTNNKVSKKKYFKAIDTIKYALEELTIILESQVAIKEILNIYARKVTFLSFIKSEKGDLFHQVDKQMLRSKMLNLSSNEKYCWNQKKKVCQYKVQSDYVFATLLTINFIFAPLIFF